VGDPAAPPGQGDLVPARPRPAGHGARLRRPGELLDAWAALDAAAAADETVVAVIDDLPVQAMLEAKARMEDLVRDLRLALLHHEQGDAEPTTPADEEEVAVARMLDDAVTEFADGRSQLRRQVVEAASHGQRRVDLVVRLRPDQGGAVRRYRQALDAADELGRRGKLLLAGSLVEHADLRRTYLDEIIRQLEA